MVDIKYQLNADFDKSPHIRVNLIDGRFYDLEFINMLSSFGVEIIDDTSEETMQRLLTKHFPDWKEAEWGFDHDWDNTLWAKIYVLTVDGVDYHVGDPEDEPHPIFREIEYNINQTHLATEGIMGVSRAADETD